MNSALCGKRKPGLHADQAWPDITKPFQHVNTPQKQFIPSICVHFHHLRPIGFRETLLRNSLPAPINWANLQPEYLCKT
jgi:hypothetical protein